MKQELKASMNWKLEKRFRKICLSRLVYTLRLSARYFYAMRFRSVANLIKHSTIVIYDFGVVLIKLLNDSRVVTYDRRGLVRLAESCKQTSNIM